MQWTKDETGWLVADGGHGQDPYIWITTEDHRWVNLTEEDLEKMLAALREKKSEGR